MARVAFLTLAIMQGPEEDPRVRGFIDRIDANFTAAAGSPGFIARVPSDEASPWGSHTRPASLAGAEFAGRIAQTLTLWQDLEAVFAFAYSGPHAEALNKRKEWFVKGEWPIYAAWWVADDHTPTWAEAYERYEQLHSQGPTPAVFDFKQPFDAQGEPYKLQRDAIKRKAARPAIDIDTVVGAYLAAWNEPDPHTRQRLLDAVWQADGTYTDPQSYAANRAGLDAVIAQFLYTNPGAKFTLTGQIAYHHHYVRFYWRLRLANGAEILGMDYGEVSAEGRLAKIVGFF